MATNKSKLELGSGPMKHSVTHPPSFFVLVVGSREETHPRILELSEGGFLTLHFDPSHKHPAWHPEAGTFIPSDDEVTSFEQESQINPGTGYRDGDKYIITTGRGRLKKAALINEARSEKTGKHTESFLYLFTAAPRGTTEDDVFSQMVGENFDRRSEKPSSIAFLIRRARSDFRWDKSKCEQRFHLSAQMQEHYVSLLDCADDVRAMVDNGSLALRTAAECLSKIERAKQMPALKECAARGVTKGESLYVCLKRLSQDLPMFGDDGEMPPPPPSNDGSSDAVPDTATPPDASATPAATTPGKRTKKPAEPSPPKHVHVRPPTKQRLALWIDALKPHTAAEPPRMPKSIPAEIKKAVDEALESAFFEGARIMALRMQGKTPPGWGKLRDVLESEEGS